MFHPDEMALIDAIHADPRCDTVRLVYADWLEEHDEPDCAEFIRLLCQEPDLVLMWGSRPRVSPECKWFKFDSLNLCSRAMELLTRLYGTLRYPQSQAPDRYSRGLPQYWIRRDDDDLPCVSLPPDFPQTPLLRLDLVLRTEHLAEWLAHPLMAKVDRLDIVPAYLETVHVVIEDQFWATAISLFDHSPLPDRLSALKFCGCNSPRNRNLARQPLEPRVRVSYEG